MHVLLSAFSHLGCSLLVQNVLNKLVVEYINQECEVNIFKERFKIKRGLGSALVCLIFWTI